MLKKIAVILIVFSLALAGVVFYLNKVVLPVKAKSFIIKGLEDVTRKKVSLRGLRINIFKGLLLEGLSISDEAGEIISVKEASCGFLIPPIFQRKIIIPFVRFESAVISLERKSDNTFNIASLFGAKKEEAAAGSKPKFDLFIYKITVRDSRIDFKDNTLPVAFTRSLEGLNLFVSLSLPASVKFKGQASVKNEAKIILTGEFNIPRKQLDAAISLKELSPNLFAAYYEKSGILASGGPVEAMFDIALKDNVLTIEADAQGRKILLSKDKLKFNLSSEIKGNLRYAFASKELKFSGAADIKEADISGVEVWDKISGIAGRINFDNSGLSSDKISANAGGIPIEIKGSLKNFQSPLLSADITSNNLDLAAVQALLKEKLQVNLAASVQGKANLRLNVEAQIPLAAPKIKGYLDIANTIIKPDKLAYPVEKIIGRLEFDPSGISWSEAAFEFMGIPYETSGALVNFKSPEIKLKLESRYLLLNSDFAFKDKIIKIAKCDGEYFNSKFSLAGDIDTSDSANLIARLNGTSDIELSNLKDIFKKSAEKLEKARLRGKVRAEFSLEGNAAKIKDCAIGLNLSSRSISAYGLQGSGFSLEYNQSDGLADIVSARMDLYGGILEAAAKMNLKSDNLPWWIAANMQGVKLEELKRDTAMKDKDISGALQAETKINGFSGNTDKISGAGKILISEGKLWQLDLFKGIGTLIFAKDFANVVFHEASCGFAIQDKYVSSDSIKLKSQLIELSGTAKIGFDSSLDASIDVQILDQGAPETGTFKDIATAILGSVGRMGVITISGTLGEPKYKFTPAVADIVKGLKDTFLDKIFQYRQ